MHFYQDTQPPPIKKRKASRLYHNRRNGASI
nr:MAG TPA: hypothetical protein [Bacteriophage sp.]